MSSIVACEAKTSMIHTLHNTRSLVTVMQQTTFISWFNLQQIFLLKLRLYLFSCRRRIDTMPNPNGYWVLSTCGDVFTHSDAVNLVAGCIEPMDEMNCEKWMNSKSERDSSHMLQTVVAFDSNRDKRWKSVRATKWPKVFINWTQAVARTHENKNYCLTFVRLIEFDRSWTPCEKSIWPKNALAAQQKVQKLNKHMVIYCKITVEFGVSVCVILWVCETESGVWVMGAASQTRKSHSKHAPFFGEIYRETMQIRCLRALCMRVFVSTPLARTQSR